MPFSFPLICDLLQDLDNTRRRATNSTGSRELIRNWFKKHRSRIQQDGFNYPALLSTLLPEKRSDRVYNIRERKLQRLVAGSLLLGQRRQKELARWTEPGSGLDLADCVERSLRETRSPRSSLGIDVTIEEIDEVFQGLASTCRWSSPAIRSKQAQTRENPEQELSGLYRRLSPRDAKWFTRLVLKDYSPVLVDSYAVYSSCHRLLPTVLKVRDDFVVACSFLQRYGGSDGQARVDRQVLDQELKPAIGTKVGRQTWVKGRSIKHCLQMVYGSMSCEEKIDGEYCQIHIDVQKGTLQIFSKSGKDSTEDREGLHSAIRNSLRLGQPDCPLKTNCILEGELVVYSDREKKILDFYRIKNYVSRRGTFIGLGPDVERHSWEHLMIIFFDVLMVDDESLLGIRQSQRFERLRRLITCVEGHSELVQREVICYGRRSAASDLIHAFARCIAAGKEGLVLKPDDPYFSFSSSSQPYSSCVVKLKKEYLGGFGDVGDFAVVGARYDAAKAKTYDFPNLKWTHFFIGCLRNKEEVLRWDWKPEFLVTNVVELNATQLKAFMASAHSRQVSESENHFTVLEIGPSIDEGRKPSIIFADPPVFDMRCFSFDKEKAAKFWTPRFPMVNKIHVDRTYRDVITFAELQDMAVAEKESNVPQDSQQIKDLIATLGGDNEDSWTQSTVSSGSFADAVSQALSQSHGAYDATDVNLSAGLPLLDEAGDVGHASIADTCGQSTPPSSSAVQSPRKAKTTDVATSPPKNERDNKRRLESPAKSQRSSKVLRRSQDQTDAPSATPPSSAISCPNSERAPLSDVKAGSPRRNRKSNGPIPRLPGVASMHAPFTAKEPCSTLGWSQIPSSMSASCYARLTKPVSPPKPILGKSILALESGLDGSSRCSPEPGRCRYCPEECDLANFSFLVAPHVKEHSRLAEALLADHGVTDFILDPRDWAIDNSCASKPSSREGTPTPTQPYRPRRRRRNKIAIVDNECREARDAFLKCITAANLPRQNGSRYFVPVYDWRVLEDLSAEEARCSRYGENRDERFDRRSGSSLWSRRWVGLA